MTRYEKYLLSCAANVIFNLRQQCILDEHNEKIVSDLVDEIDKYVRENYWLKDQLTVLKQILKHWQDNNYIMEG